MVSAVCRLAVAAAFVVAALPLAHAGAAPPMVEVIPYDSIEVVAPGEPLASGTNVCSFAVTLHHQGTFVYRTFFDRQGAPVRQLVRSAGFTETYSANGRSLSTVSVAPAHLRAADGGLTITATGNQRHVIVPGIGPVLAQAGRFVVDPDTGSLTAVFGLDIPAGREFCAALAV